MQRILIADDHEVVRAGLIQILKKAIPGASVEEAADGREVLARVNEARYSLVLLDISMPGRGGLEVLKEIKSCLPGVPVLILSMHPEEEYALRALRAGASGYVTKQTAPEELAKAVLKVLAGGRYVSASLERLDREGKSRAVGNHGS